MNPRHPDVILAELDRMLDAGALSLRDVLRLSREMSTYWLERCKRAETDADRLAARLFALPGASIAYAHEMSEHAGAVAQR